MLLLATRLSPVLQSDAVINENSFAPPFKTFGSDGARVVDAWTHGGHTEIKQHFVRLTADRQSKQGYLWNNQGIAESDRWTARLRFRVSGQGKTLFGDGLGLWFTQHERYQPGSIFGFTPSFVGFGVVFDTFRNVESGHQHRDASLLFSDGVTEASFDGERPGCDSAYRYYEGRDDFSVQKYSEAKVTLQGSRISLSIDAEGSGAWQTCFDVDLNQHVTLPDGWHRTARFGLTASTGQLADNHDVLRLVLTRPEQAAAHEAAEQREKAVPSVVAAAASGQANLPELVAKVKTLEDKIEHLSHHLDHQLAAINDGLRATIKKLQGQEDKSADRIAQLEERLGVELNERMEGVEGQLIDHLQDKAEETEQAIRKGINSVAAKAKEVAEKATAATGGWKLPFVVLLVVLAVAGFFVYSKYKQLMKRHLL